MHCGEGAWLGGVRREGQVSRDVLGPGSGTLEPTEGCEARGERHGEPAGCTWPSDCSLRSHLKQRWRGLQERPKEPRIPWGPRG